MAENAIREAPPVFQYLIAQIKSTVAESKSPEEALSRISSLRANRKFLDGLFEILRDSIESSEALGRSLIVQKDRSLSTESITRGADLNWFVADGNTVGISFDLIPKEALDYIRYKALTIAGIENGKLLEIVKEKIKEAIRDGNTVEEFGLKLDLLFDSYGITRLDRRHLETIFRTNVFTAYSIGSQAQVEEMKDRFPYWRYSAVLDNRTRPDHRDLNGNVYRVGEGPIPPIDYNCRCTAIYLHVSQVEREHLSSLVQEWNSGEPGFGDPNVRFNTRESFEKWRRENQGVLSSDILSWIQSNL